MDFLLVDLLLVDFCPLPAFIATLPELVGLTVVVQLLHGKLEGRLLNLHVLLLHFHFGCRMSWAFDSFRIDDGSQTLPPTPKIRQILSRTQTRSLALTVHMHTRIKLKTKRKPGGSHCL